MAARPEKEVIKLGATRVRNAYGLPRDSEVILERNVRAPMRDGISLATNVFRPAESGKYPVILHLSTMGKDTFPADASYDRVPNTGLIRVSEYAIFEAPDPMYWVPHGYVVISADCRGSWDSEGGRFEHLTRQTGQDFHDLVEWAAGQAWCDGNVGANGVSYLAITQWLGAAEQPPHLKAILPWEGLNDPYREWAFHGGIPDCGFFRAYFGRTADRVHPGTPFEDWVAGQKEHPLYDEYWRKRHPDLSKVNVPAYICASWSSHLHNRGALEGYKQISSNEKWLEIHGRKEWETYYRRESLERQRRFLDCFLKGKDSGIRELPRVRYEVRERFYEGRIQFADDFPVPGTAYRKLFLHPRDEKLSETASSSEASIRYSATRSNERKSKAEFTIAFDEQTDLVGYMKLRLWVSAEGGDDMDIHVGIRKFDRHGSEVHLPDYNHLEEGIVAVGWLRASHRELDEKRSKPWQPWLKHERLLKLAPGEIVPVDIEILPSGTRFEKGETLQLTVQGTDVIDFFYRYRHDETVNKGDHVLYAGGKYDSHLLVPVIPNPSRRG